MLFDTHAHFDDPQFDADRDEVLRGLKDLGVGKVMDIGASLDTTRKAIEIAEKYDFVYATAGVHPSETIGMTEENMEELRRLALASSKVRAIGEIGLDYHYEDTNPEEQQHWFRRQLELAKELDMPVVIHDRDSKGKAIEILKEMGITNGVMHCFSGSAEIAKELVKMGFMISFTGVLTFKNARRAVEACAAVPLERLMVETDCPYMALEPHRGERNFSGYVRFVAEKMAEIKGVSYEELVRITTENAERFYRI
ncbi:MAG: TatD family hydrolase [Clostridia bacterium]|nr:TatD family hydrolase [Clostridia bacterium]